MIRAFLAVALLLFSQLAAALIPASPVYNFTRAGHVGSGTSTVAACADLDAKLRTTTIEKADHVAGSPNRCRIARVSDNGQLALLNFTTSGSVCPANSTSVGGGQCQCSSGYVEDGGMCVPEPSVCVALSGVTTGRSEMDINMGNLTVAQMQALVGTTRTYNDKITATDTCQATGEVLSCGKLGNEVICTFGSSTYTGETPAPDSTAPLKPQGEAPKLCETGKCPGTINGVNVCVPCGDFSSAKTTDKETNKPDGTIENETTSSKTTCIGDKCTTEKTTTKTDLDASGTVTGTGTTTEKTEQSKGDYCKENPNDAQCKDERGSFSGSCESSFVCEGDAVQCAQARAAQELHCTAKKLPDGVGDVAGALLDAGIPEGLHLDGPVLAAPTAVTGSCAITDFSVELVFGQSLTVPLSQFCQFMDTLRAVIGVLGVLAFSVIVFRG